VLILLRDSTYTVYIPQDSCLYGVCCVCILYTIQSKISLSSCYMYYIIYFFTNKKKKKTPSTYFYIYIFFPVTEREVSLAGFVDLPALYFPPAIYIHLYCCLSLSFYILFPSLPPLCFITFSLPSSLSI
jgi:hypothetical protein